MDCASGSRWATIWPNNWAKPGHFEIENFYNICRIVSRDLDWSLCSLYFANYFARFDILGRTSRACSTVRFTVCIPEVRNRKQTESGTQMNKVTLSMVKGMVGGLPGVHKQLSPSIGQNGEPQWSQQWKPFQLIEYTMHPCAVQVHVCYRPEWWTTMMRAL